MKKKFLAVNVALALGAMVVGSAAYAAAASTALGDVDVLAEGAQAASFALPGNVVVSDSYEGLINVVPYYSVQEGNTVALSITNNDIINGKVVKVRFRGAEWSDDVLDFQVFLSPGDIWTAALTKEFDSITGQYVAKLNWSGDNTVTRPRLDAAGALFHADARVKGTNGNTLEGYVEIITLADIPPVLNGATAAAGTEFGGATDDTVAATGTNIHTNPLYTLTKHVDGAAPPAYAISGVYDETIGKLVQDSYWNYPSVGAAVRNSDGLHTYTVADPGTGGGWTQVGGAEYQGHNQFGASKTRASDDWLQFPTPAISSYVSIINVQSRKAYTLQSTALRNAPVIEGIYQLDDSAPVGSTGDGAYTTAAVTATGKADAPVTSVRGSIKAYFEQKGGLYVTWNGRGEKITADNIFGGVDGGGAVVGAGVDTRLAGLVLQELDLPDLSTPTTAAVADVGFSVVGDTAATLTAGAGLYPDGPAAAQRDLVASALQAGAFRFEYVTDLGLQASTDIVLNQPVRRYYYWYSAGTSASHHREFTYPAGYWNISGERNTPYASLSGLGNSIEVGGAVFYNREEQSYVAATPGGSTWSPQPPASVTPTGLRGEVSVLAINSTAPYSGALSAQLTKNDTPVLGNYRNGWGSFSTATKANTGGLPAASGYGFATDVNDAHALLRKVNYLPVIAYSAINVYSPASGAVYGTTLPVRILK
ncbi:hypothetical protein FACS1894116_13390 [Betaproteobacteria bacterium]|nr:hypothetical protein FACS1894116_13390 [Betaproteobacteria bacterium]GHU25949.1 hypothetical protein FACS189488_13790 [Betaproteobacteria bacterium]